MASRLSVVIPNWNGERFLRICLASLRNQSFKDFETLVVDNGSTDGSVKLVREDFPEVKVIGLGANLGFSAAVNVGIKTSASELVVLLNNDTEQDERWLESLVKTADECHETIGFFASKLIDFHARSFLDGAGDALRLSGLPYRLGHGEHDHGQFDKASSVFGACAAAAMYRRSMLNEIGLFDEDFVSYCEDVDLSFRANLAGYYCVYVPDAVVFHMGSASTGGKRSETATYLGTRNSIWLLVKNLPLSNMPHILPLFVFGQFARLVSSALSGSLIPYLKGLSGAIGKLRHMVEKRRKIQSKKRVSDGEILRLLRSSSLAASSSILRRSRDALWSKLQ